MVQRTDWQENGRVTESTQDALYMETDCGRMYGTEKSMALRFWIEFENNCWLLHLVGLRPGCPTAFVTHKPKAAASCLYSSASGLE